MHKLGIRKIEGVTDTVLAYREPVPRRKNEWTRKKCTEDPLYQLGQILFYIGLVLELLIVIADKSAYINPWRGSCFDNLPAFLGKICLYPLFIQGMACGCCFFL